ncbi:MAG: glycerol-3-phosphate acyltransferase, partial [Alphaproteobacteria bacterium]|nr:glycerol-3-phosphate acyltransferase [Alphaproteobacteria bacterium]
PLLVSLSVPFAFTYFGRSDLVPLSVVLIALVFYKHTPNIRRLLNRTEPKIGSHAKKPPDAQ